VRRIGRYILHGLTVLSLVLCVATVGLWVRSCSIDDGWVARPATDRYIGMRSVGGNLELSWRIQDGDAAKYPWRFGRGDFDMDMAAAPRDVQQLTIRSASPGTAPPRPFWLGNIGFESSSYLLALPTHHWPLPHLHLLNYSGALWRGNRLFVPHWLLAGILLALPGWRGIRGARRRRRSGRSAGRCSACGYDLRATPDRCPECGAVPAEAKR
jgi:hypothetical protein